MQKKADASCFNEQRNASKHDIGITTLPAGGQSAVRNRDEKLHTASRHLGIQPQVGAWLRSGGEHGEQPPEGEKQL